MSRLSHALKARFGTARNVMKKLGLDDALLDFDEAQSEGERAEESLYDKPLTSLRSAVDKLVGKHSARDDDPMVQELRQIAERHDRAASDRRKRGRDSLPPKIKTMPDENLGDDDYEPLREHLREAELDDEAIERAVELGRDHVRRRSANGHARVSRDVLPRNASMSSKHGGGFGGHLSGGRARDESPEERTQREAASGAIIDHGLDKRSWGAHDGLGEVSQIRTLLKRFGPGEAGARPDRYRDIAMDGNRRRLGASEAQKARLYKLVPGLALIGSASEDGVGRRDPTRRNPYEVI